MSDCMNQGVAPWILTSEGAAVQKKVYDHTLAVLGEIEPGVRETY